MCLETQVANKIRCAILITYLPPFRSDADSDVLADYVLALIRADTPEPELRLNAIENLEDFLKDSRRLFSILWLIDFCCVRIELSR